MEEQLDIFDDKYRPLGSAGKKEVHSKGLWHRVFTCILVNPKTKTVLLQKKVPGKYSFDRPDHIDVSVGGHYMSGESISDGVRELSEEVGVNKKIDELIFIGIRQTAATIKTDYIANEFQHIFICPIEQNLEDYKLEEAEVSGLIEMNIQEAIDLLLGKIGSLKARGLSVVDGKRTIYDQEITKDDFVPAYLQTDQFFLRLFVAAKRYVRNDDPSEIFC